MTKYLLTAEDGTTIGIYTYEELEEFCEANGLTAPDADDLRGDSGEVTIKDNISITW